MNLLARKTSVTDYYDLLVRIHSFLKPRTYVEFIPYDYGEVEHDKAQQLNRMENRWHEIKSLLAAPP